MMRDKIVIILTAVGSAWCWWPVIREPSLEFPRWILLGLILLIALFATLITNRRWQSVFAVTLGSFLGMCAGWMVWPSDDGIANSYAGIVIVIATLAVFAVGMFAVLLVRALSSVSSVARPVFWIALIGCFAFGPVMMAVTPPLIAQRVARNDRLATERVTAMKKAIELARPGSDGAGQRCDVYALNHRYSGPAVSESDWHRLLVDYAVKEDGYIFMVKCAGNGAYRVDARPERSKGDGTRYLCADDSGEFIISAVSDEQQWRSAFQGAGSSSCPKGASE